MQGIAVNLLVLRTSNLNQAARFYSALGLTVTLERHGDGPVNLSANIGSVLLEIYLSKESRRTTGVTFGFQVVALDRLISTALSAGGKMISPPASGAWGLRAVISDPDGHRIELLQV